MKQLICILLCLCFIFSFVGCKKEQANIVTSTDTSTTSSAASTISTPSKVASKPKKKKPALAAKKRPKAESSAPATQELSQSDTQLTTPHFVVTIPSFWNNNYAVRNENAEGVFRYCFVDPLSEKELGGHIFTIELYEDPIVAAQTCSFNGEYYGVLQADTTYTVILTYPTDVQYINGRKEIYQQMYNSCDQVMKSLTPVGGGKYTPVTDSNYKTRAALLKQPITGKEMTARFAKETGTALTYVGFCLDRLNTQINGKNEALYDYAHHLYQDAKGASYVVPISLSGEADTMETTVYKIATFPNITAVRSTDYNAFETLCKDFFNTSALTSGEYCLKDIDGEGIPELLLLQNKLLTVYTLQNNIVTPAGQFSVTNNTLVFNETDLASYPQIFTQYVENGKTMYGYLLWKNGTLQHQLLARKDTANPTDKTPYTALNTNKQLAYTAAEKATKLEFKSILY